jgi:hypothetical protein
MGGGRAYFRAVKVVRVYPSEEARLRAERDAAWWSGAYWGAGVTMVLAIALCLLLEWLRHRYEGDGGDPPAAEPPYPTPPPGGTGIVSARDLWSRSGG